MLVIFLQYIKKICCYWFVLYCYAKHSDILRRSSHVCCYLLVKKSHSILLQTNCTHFGKSELFSTNIYQTFCFTAKHILRKIIKMHCPYLATIKKISTRCNLDYLFFKWFSNSLLCKVTGQSLWISCFDFIFFCILKLFIVVKWCPVVYWSLKSLKSFFLIICSIMCKICKFTEVRGSIRWLICWEW